MELKVICPCGQKYKFDVEPVNGQMPFTVNCPVCGVDGTPLANQLLAQTSAAPAVVAPVMLAPAPAPAPVTTASGLRITINRPAPASIPPPVASPSGAPPPIGAPGLARALPAATDPNKSAKKPNFWMGLVGAFLGSLVGAAICFLIGFLIAQYIGIGWRFVGMLAGSLLAGYLAGAGAHLLGKGEGSKELGAIAAIFAIVGIVAAQYFMALTWWHETVVAITDSVYGESVKEAREAVAVIPTGSDSEIRLYLAKQEAEDSDNVTTNSISDDDVKQFRENQLPEFQQLASGQMTKEQYDAKYGIGVDQEKKDQDAEDETFKGVFLLLFLRRSSIFSLCLGAGLAYRITANA